MLLPGLNMMKMDVDIGIPRVGQRRISVAPILNELVTLLDINPIDPSTLL